MIDNSVSGIFVLGSNGEFHVIRQQEKIEFAKRVVEMVDHRVPVFAGPGACSTQETIETATIDEFQTIIRIFELTGEDWNTLHLEMESCIIPTDKLQV